MSEFTVRGEFQSRDGWSSFEKTLDAENENVAVEHTYSQLGSHHGLNRAQIEIEEVGE